jgi:hypothetical protein
MTIYTADMITFFQNFALNKDVEVTTSKAKFVGKLIRLDKEGNLYILNKVGHLFVQRQYVISVQILEKSEVDKK